MDKLSEETRLLLAFIISIFIIFIFSKYQRQRYLPYPLPEETKFLQEKKLQQEDILEEIFEYENNNYYLCIDKGAGYIRIIGLKKFLRKNEKYLVLSEGNLIFSLLDFIKKSSVEINSEKNLVFTFRNENFLFNRILKVPEDSYILSCEEKIKNLKNESINLNNCERDIIRLNLENIKTQKDYIPPKILIGINRLPIFIDPLRIKEARTFKNCNFIGFLTRYSLILIYLPEKGDILVKLEDNSISLKQIFNLILNPMEEKIFTYKFYAGPSDYFIARDYIKENIFGKGFFVNIGRFLFLILKGIYKIIPNWGFAIIILTVLIKIIFYPLTKKSLYSMKQLQKLRPYLQDIQKKYKDNPYQLQRELMNIYKEYKINPFAGCLPTMIQIPIFIGFFLSLRNSIFLRGAPFILWIKDLSLPDTVFRVKNFPINILPILMTITSYFQQKLTPTTDQSQKSLSVILPLMFLFILYNFPSSLLLYWVTMNICGLIEQYFVSNSIQIKFKRGTHKNKVKTLTF